MILEFKEIKKEDISVAGGKGANLGELTAAGFCVPKGFVITAETYRVFLRENGIDGVIEKELSDAGTDENHLLRAASMIQESIQQGVFSNEVKTRIVACYETLGIGARVAVRSSATAEDLPDASFAGQQETYLNVSGVNELLDRVRCCYASLWGSRAVSYRQNQGYGQENIAIAVVVQEMVESEKSGVLFTVNPVSNKASEMQINANYGLGESVVSGRVTADSYVVDRKGNVLDITIGTKETQIVYGIKETKEAIVDEKKRAARVLRDEELADLVTLGLAVEAHYGYPMDIEWAIRDGMLYVLQARAITTLKKVPEDADEEQRIESYLKETRVKGLMRKTLSFQLEKMPFAYRVLDFDYMIVINQQKANIFAENGLVVNSNPQIDDDGIQTLPSSKKGINGKIFRVFGMLRMLQDYDYCAKQCRRFMPGYQEEVEAIKALDFDEMTLAQCRDFMAYSYELIHRLTYDRFKYALFPSALRKSLERAIKQVNPNYSAFDFYWELDNKTSLVTENLLQMTEKIKGNLTLKTAVLSGMRYDDLCAAFSDFKRMTDDFIKQHGYKSDYNCYCLDAKTFIEQPNRIVSILRPLVAEDRVEDSLKDELTATGVAKKQDFSALMAELKRIYGKQYPALEQRVDNFRYFHVVREESQYLWETIFYYVRQCVKRSNILLLGNAAYDVGIANLFHKELLAALDRGRLDETDKEKIARRNQLFPFAGKVWEASKALVFEQKGDVLKGIVGSTGVVVGRVCIIYGPEEFYKMQKGDVLVCHLTDPEWTPLFHLASAVVADTGSALSHAAIVAREFGIPAVLGVGVATTRLKNGSMVRVDGVKGEISLC